jgi:hypothetical protein
MCGFKMDLGDAYENYRGEVRCWVCHGMLEVTLEEGQLKAMRVSPAGGPVPTVAESEGQQAESPSPPSMEGGG